MTTLPNWDGVQYGWFDVIDFNKFVKRIDGDFDCINHSPHGSWKNFWNFYFSWKVWKGDSTSFAPEWVTVYPMTKSEVQHEMVIWCKIITETYKELQKAKLEGSDIKKYTDTLLYWGWATPKEPFNMIDITRNISEYYFTTKTMDGVTTYDKNQSAPFCTEPLVLSKTGDRIDEFYFVAPAQISKAYIEAEVDGVKKIFKSAKDIPQNAKRKYIVAGSVSDTTRDLDDEKMSEKAIQSMLETAGKGEIPLRNAHKKEWDSDLGKLTEINIIDDENNTLMCKFELNDFEEDPFAKKLWYAVKKGKKIGFSIGGIVHKYHDEWDSDIGKNCTVYDEIELKEISVTGQPANTNTFIYAISKAMKELNKKPLSSASRRKLPKGKFAYVDAEGKGHLPINDASHVRNAMARFNQTDMPASAKAGAWKKILAAARKFGIKVNPKLKKSEKEICQDLELQKFEGAGMYLQSIMDAIWQMRNDLKDHMDHDDEESEELNDTLEDIKDELEEDTEDKEAEVCQEEESSDSILESESDFRILVKIMALIASLPYPKDAKVPENYWDLTSSLPSEAYIYAEGQPMLPHHNRDYTVNRELLMYQLKQVLDGDIYVDADEYLEILNHLSYHIQEMTDIKVKKSTEAEAQPDGTPVEAVKPLEAQPEVVTVEQPVEVTVETPVEAPVETPAAPAEESKTEEVKVEEPVAEEVKEEPKEEKPVEEPKIEETKVEEPVVEPVVEEPKTDEALKSLEERVIALSKTNAELAAKLEAIANEPVYKTATGVGPAIVQDGVSGASLKQATGLRFDVTKNYSKEEALKAVDALSPYDKFRHKQAVRQLYI